MTGAPPRPDRVVSAPLVVPIASPPLAEGAVAIATDGTIAAVGLRAEVLRRHPGLPEARAAGALLPGLVNAHTHLELSALAGRVPGGGGLVAWAAQIMMQGRPPADASAAAIRAAARQLVDAGTAAVGDVGNTLAAVPALAEAGLAGIFFHELLGSREQATGDAIADAARERAAFVAARGWPAGLAYVCAPHAPYSVGPELFRRLFAAAAAAGLPTSVHVAEDEDEIALLGAGTGRWPAILERLGVPVATRVPRARPVRHLEALGAFAGPVPPLLVHMVHADADDRRRARAAGATAVLCPRSNLHIGGRLPDVPALRTGGVALALGTDSLASAPDLSLWGEIATLAESFPAVAPDVWLAAATAGGAAALRLPALGALAPGRRPGVVEVVTDEPRPTLATLVRTPRPHVRWHVPPSLRP